jgi:hypothetical protein
MLNQAPHHENEWGGGGIAPPFLTSALIVGEHSASYAHRPLYPGESAPSTHWIGSCGGGAQEAVWRLWSKEKSPAPPGNQTPAV